MATAAGGNGSAAASTAAGGGVFSDFCEAWVSRFPGSELPAAWEEDVRANLKKHRTKVAILREELEKEEMYVEYLDKLLADIELHRKRGSGGGGLSSPRASASKEGGEAASSKKFAPSSRENSSSASSSQQLNGNGESSARRQQFLDDHLEDCRTREAVERTSLRLDLDDVRNVDGGDASTFVTVINVPSPDGKKKGGLSLSKGKQNSESALLPSSKPPPPRAPPKRASVGSRDSLNSALSSSAVTPASPRFSYAEDFMASSDAREGMNTLDPKDPLLQAKLSSSSEETLDDEADSSSAAVAEDGFMRGRPDGKDNSSPANSSSGNPGANGVKNEEPLPPRSTKIKELMANWENKPPIGMRPVIRLPNKEDGAEASGSPSAARSATQRKDSDSSSRGRMGSPSGKSHDSSDSENSWSRMRAASGEEDSTSPRTRRRISGETRLDRLVRRPSGSAERGSSRHSEGLPAPVPPKPAKKPKAKPRTIGHPQLHQQQQEEPLYDTVANDEPEDEYDNHLLYGTSSSTQSGGGRGKADTIGSGGGSSSATDLGFVDEAPSPHASILKSGHSGLSLTGSGTLSSSSDAAGSSSSLRRAVSVEEEEEGNYVNIQYFLQKRQGAKSSSASAAMDTIQSDDELEDSDGKPVSSASSRELLDEPLPHPSSARIEEEDEEETSSQVERLVMYRCILNSIVESEAIYLEGLSVMLQYMKAMKVTMSTPQPVIPREDFDVIFYKIPELHELHYAFHESLRRHVDRRGDGEERGGGVGHSFKMLASRTKIYAAFLENYPRALDCLRRCTASHPQFADLTRSIKLRSVGGSSNPGTLGQTASAPSQSQSRQAQSLSLEDLLHKPVQRVQKLDLCLQDLIRSASGADKLPLREALDGVHRFLSEYNVAHQGELFPRSSSASSAGAGGPGPQAAGQEQRRHLVKNSFVVELSDGQRKLRHLFLFNDVLVCAKYKAAARSRAAEKFTFQIKWYIPLCNVSLNEKGMAAAQCITHVSCFRTFFLRGRSPLSFFFGPV